MICMKKEGEVFLKAGSKVKHVLVVALLMFSMVFVIVPLNNKPVSALDVTSWQYYKKITIDHTKVPATLTNFPVLFLNTSASFAHAQADGDDFMFVANGNTTKYNHEIESFASNKLIAWVNITTMSSSVDTVVWLYYGNSGCSSQQNPTGVWNSNYKVVLHMNGTTTIQDSTSNNHDGTATSDEATGFINKAQSFTKTSSDYINMGDANDFSFGDASADIPFTWSCWMKPDYTETSSYQYYSLFNKFSTNNWEYQYYYVTKTGVAHRFDVLICDESTDKYQSIFYTYYPSKTSYNYVTLTYNANELASGLNFYVNGTKVSRTCTNMSGYVAMENKNANLEIGALNGADFYNGLLDEVHISNVERNSSWISAEYNNQYSPSTFLSVSIEIANPTFPIVPSAPVYFEARTQNSSRIMLNWTHGATGVDKTVIRANIGSYPTLSTGSTIYNGTLHGYNHTGLVNNTHWFYRCYTWNSTGVGTYNTTSLRSHDTTMGISLVNVSMTNLNCTGSYTSEIGNRFVYQEDSDTATGGLITNAVDGIWTTYEEGDGSSRTWILNYTAPSMCWNATWMVKDYDSLTSSIVYHNFSLNHSVVSQGYAKMKVETYWGDTELVIYYVFYNGGYTQIYTDSDTSRFYEEAVNWYWYGYLVNFTAESQLNIQETLVNCTAINVSHWVSPYWDIWFNATGTGNGTGNASGSVIVNVNGRSFTWFFTVGLFGGVSFGMVLWRRKRRKEG
ncbi:hypothetical protein CCP3SC1AL1_2050003 [Gammaproteobacteria bacterium]